MQIEALAELNKGLLNTLSDNIDSYIYNPDDIVVLRDSRAAGMYLIATGEVEASYPNGTIENLREKQYFLPACLIQPITSSTTYKAKSFCELLVLRSSVFRHICESYMTKPEFDAFVESRLRPYCDLQREPSRKFEKQAAIPMQFSRFSKRDYVISVTANVFPDSEIRGVWDSIVFCGLVFYLTSLPLLLAVMMHPAFVDRVLVMLCFGFLADMLFLVDVVLHCTIFAYWEEGIICSEQNKIWTHFWTRNSPLYIFLELFPFDIIIGFGYDIRLYCIFRLLKLLQSVRFAALADRFVHAFTSFTGVAVSFEKSRFVMLYFMLFQVCHWGGCVWRLAADVAEQIFHYEVTWVSVDRNGLLHADYTAMPVTEYTRSIYWAASVMSSIGFPDILARNNVEVCVVIVVIFFGYLMFNTCLGAIGNLVSSFNREEREFKMKVERIRQVLRHNKISSSVEMRAMHYFDHLWTRYNGMNEEEVLSYLPPTLRGAVVRCVIGPLLTSISFFKNCSEPMENLLLSMVEARCFLDGDTLMIAGELGKEMFIIEVTAEAFILWRHLTSLLYNNIHYI